MTKQECEIRKNGYFAGVCSRKCHTKTSEENFAHNIKIIEKIITQKDRDKTDGIIPPKQTNSEQVMEEFNEKFGDTDVYPNDLIPKNDVIATREHIKKFILSAIQKAKAEGYNAGVEAVLERIPDNLIPAGTNTSYMEGLKSQLKKELTK